MRSEKSTMSAIVLVALMVNSKGDSGFCLGILNETMKMSCVVYDVRL